MNKVTKERGKEEDWNEIGDRGVSLREQKRGRGWEIEIENEDRGGVGWGGGSIATYAT